MQVFNALLVHALRLHQLLTRRRVEVPTAWPSLITEAYRIGRRRCDEFGVECASRGFCEAMEAGGCCLFSGGCAVLPNEPEEAAGASSSSIGSGMGSGTSAGAG